MTRDVQTVSPETSLASAARKMRIWDIGFLPVTDRGIVLGVVTDRDIALRGLGEGRMPETTTIRQIMTPLVVWCYEDEVLTDAAEIMEENQVRRLVVFDRMNRLAGLLSLDDLATFMSSDRLLGSVLRRLSTAA
jgi:CBS domain-containing protein